MIKNILKNSLAIYLYQGFALIFGMLISIIVARSLGPEIKGKIDLFLLTGTMIVELLILGIGSAMIRLRAKFKYDLNILHSINIYYSIFIAFVSLIVILYLYFISVNYIYLLSIFVAPILLYKQIGNAILISLDKAIITYKINFFMIACLLICIIGMYFLGLLTLNSYLILFLFTTIISVIFIYKLIIFHNVSKESISFNFKVFKELISFGFIIYLGALVNIMHFKIDQIMISLMLSISDLGIYTISVRWAEMIFFIDTAIVNTIMYKLVSGDKNSAYKLAYIASYIIFIFGIIFCIFLYFFASELIIYLYGEKYISAVEPLIYLIPGVVFWSLSKPLSAYVTLNLGEVKLVTIFSFIGLIINIILNYFLIHEYKLIGIAISSTISYFVVFILVMITFNLKKEQRNV